jgi:hypothetical protein
MRQLSHVFENGEVFLRHYRFEGASELLFLPGRTDCNAGEEVDLEVRFQHSGYAFRTLAQVQLRRLAGRGHDLEVGALLNLVGPPTRRRMLDHARGREFPYGPREQLRVPCRFPVTVLHRRARSVAQAIDYCPGGVQIVGGPALEVGDAVQLKLQPIGALFGLSLLGQVVWIQRQPELAYGVHLRPTGSLIRRRLQWLYEKLLARSLEKNP